MLGFNLKWVTGNFQIQAAGMTVWDLFRFRPGTANLGKLQHCPENSSFGGEHRHFSGGSELGLSTARPDGSGGDGNQASH